MRPAPSPTPTGRPVANPVWDGYLADPFVWHHGDSWWAIGTGGPEAAATGRIFPILRSQDFFHWEHAGEAMEPDAAVHASAGLEYWAPAVAEDDGTFYLYHSVGQDAGAAGGGHTLRVAVSDRPEGPYRDTGRTLMDPVSTPFAIDPHPFRDRDGSWWLFYARDFLDTEAGAHAGTALVVDRLRTMTQLAGEERTVLRARNAWTLFQAERSMYGQKFDWHTLEGPCVVLHEGRYVCFFSGACYGNTSYGVDYAVADRVTGPWSAAGGEAGPRILRTVPGRVRGPGHCSVAAGPGGAEYLAYHAWDEPGRRRQMWLDELRWTPEGPRCTPTWTI